MILTILKKELKIYFSDKKGVLLTFLLPVILISLFAFSFGGVGRKKSSPRPSTLVIVDKDSTETSMNFISKLEQQPTLRLVRYQEAEAEERIRKGKSTAALIVKEGFGRAVKDQQSLPLELKYDVAREIQTRMILAVVRGNLVRNYGNIEALNNVHVKMTSVIKPSNNKPNPGLVQAVAGTAIMMLLFTIAAIGGGLLEEKEAGTLKRLLSSPIKPMDILFGKMLTGIIISILQLTAMFVFAWLAFGLPIFMDTVSLILLILTISFAVSGFGVLLVSTVKTRQQLQGMSTIIIILMSAIGGSMIPISMMPAFMQKAAVVSVNYWGIQGFFDIFWRQLTLVEILPKMGILMAIGFGMTLISMRLFKKNIVSIE
ncbi:ABC transporter permease [Pseudotenacibaculum sp. MALMAid0570]|uniref:ABC transporter permease n=1 Tax=Pseudotenacibaculum sp. MALMAid0570 TaxID=3143938 RepID=UPI0032DF0F90